MLNVKLSASDMKHLQSVLPKMKQQGNKTFFSPCRQVHFIQVPEISVLGTPDPQDCKHFLLKTGFRYVQDPNKTGFTCLSLTNAYLLRHN